MLEFQSKKTSLQKDMLLISKIKNTVPWIYVISDLNGDKNYWKFLYKRIVED